MSEIDKNRYADAEEIAAAIGKSPQTVRRMADKDNGNWVYKPEKIRGTEKKWFLISKLPTEHQDAVNLQRIKRKYLNEPCESNRQNTINGTQAPINRGDDSGMLGNASGTELVSISSADLDISQRGTAECIQSPGVGRNGGVFQRRGEIVGGGTATGRNGADQSGAGPLLDTDGKGAIGDQLLDAPDTSGHSGGSGKNEITVLTVKTTEKQRLTDGARQYILNFVEQFPGSVEKAVDFINAGFQENTLTLDMRDAVLLCNAKVNEKRLGKLSKSTVEKWQRLRNDTNSCIPKKTRTETDWKTVWWLPVFLACYRKPQKPTLKEAHREFANDWEAHGFTEKVPSYDAVFRLRKKIPALVLEWGRSTGSEYKAYQAFVRRDWSNMSSNEVWVGDGHSFKAKVRHPDKERVAFAPEVTLIIDAASRFIVGWAFSLSENQIAVSESLGNGMTKYGKPLVYYSDNGSGQTAKTIDCPAGGMLARLGVRHETGIPGNPQGRGIIEGIWDITMIAVAKKLPTFQGTGMDGEAMRKNTVAINSAKTKGEIPEFVTPWNEFKRLCEERIHWYNTQHKHSALGGKTPAEVYHSKFDDSWACHLSDEEKATLYRPFKERMPSRGEVRFLNNIYFNKKLLELPAKTKVRMAFDLRDPSVVWISDLQGVFICEAVWDGNKVAGFPVSMMDDLKEKRKVRQKKSLQEKIDLVDMEDGTVIDGEVLQRVEYMPAETLEPLKIVQADFSQQQPEEERLSYVETMRRLMDDSRKAVGEE